MNTRSYCVAVFVAVLLCLGLASYFWVGEPAQSVAADARDSAGPAQPIPAGLPGFEKGVSPFFKTYCVKCHGPAKSKGGITVHSLNGDLAAGEELDKWESVLKMLESGEMPPLDEKQPAKAEVQAVRQWIESGLRDYVQKASAVARAPKTCRLTNSGLSWRCATTCPKTRMTYGIGRQLTYRDRFAVGRSLTRLRRRTLACGTSSSRSARVMCLGIPGSRLTEIATFID